MNRTKARAVVGFVLATMLLLGVEWVAFRRQAELRAASARVRRTLVVRDEAEKVLSLLKDAESSGRGYVITGNPAPAGSYPASRSSLTIRSRPTRTACWASTRAAPAR